MTTNADPKRVLTALPTQPGSVIGRAYVHRGIMRFKVGVLTADAWPDDDSSQGYAWSFNDDDRRWTPEEAEETLRLDDWVLIGVVPLGEPGKTPAQEVATADYMRRFVADWSGMPPGETVPGDMPL